VLDTKVELQQRGCFEVFFGSSRAMCESPRMDAVSGLACTWPGLSSIEHASDNRRTDICTSTFHNGLICDSVDNCRSLPLELSEAQSTMRRAQILRPILVNRQLLLGLDRQDE
jgi:hypothetical protein